jgi:hypothetical protein
MSYTTLTSITEKILETRNLSRRLEDKFSLTAENIGSRVSDYYSKNKSNFWLGSLNMFTGSIYVLSAFAKYGNGKSIIADVVCAGIWYANGLLRYIVMRD